MTIYRVVTDNYAGYEVQHKAWFFPFWRQLNGTNTHYSLAKAIEYAQEHANEQAENCRRKKDDKKHKVVLYLGDLK